VPASVPLIKTYETKSTAPGHTDQDPAKIAPHDTLTMAHAVYMTFLHNPELRSISAEITARDARALQASLAPNPTVGVELENFGGAGELSGLSGSEITFTAGQLIELAGKRDKRTKAAFVERDLSIRDYEVKKLQVLTETVKRYLKLIGDQQQIRLNQELVGVSEQLFKTVNRRVQAGKTSPAEISRTRIMLSMAQLELNRSEKGFAADLSRLAALWGERSPRFMAVTGSLEGLKELPPADSLRKYLAANPELLRWDTKMAFQQAVAAVEEAKQTPDPSVQAGYRHIAGPDLNAFVAGFSIPLPVFDHNEGAVQEARIRVEQAELHRRNTEVLITVQLEDLYQDLLVLHADIDQSEKIIVPEAEKAYRIIQDGYLSGKFGFLDVLDAQRTLFETRKNLIAALTTYNIRIAELEGLIGRSLSGEKN
jgi:cobalt-zinc-cadmium efflux system outer membrane protein